MNKKDISKILLSGSARQKYLLIAEDIGRERHSLPRMLTDSEIRALVDSIKTPQDIKIYNTLRDADQVILHYLLALIYYRTLYSKTIAELDKFTLLWEGYQNTEELVNFILLEIKDSKKRRDIIKKAVKKAGHTIVLNPIDIDKDGYIKVNIQYEGSKKQHYSMEEILDILSKRALKELIEVKSMAQAMLEYMEEKGLSIKLYKDMIKDQIELAVSEKAALSKYSPTHTDPAGEETEYIWQELLPKYRLYPDPQTPPDPKRIEYFKREVLETK